MKKVILLILVVMVSMTLVSCKQQGTSESETQKRVSETLSIAQQYKSAYETKSAEKYLALFSDDGKFTDYGGPRFGTLDIKDQKDDAYEVFAKKEFE